MHQARRGAYRLIAELFADGPTDRLIARARDLPELDEVLPERDSDETRADHFQVLGLALSPVQSVFTSPSGEAGGPEADRVIDAYRQVDFRHRADLAPDGLANQLAFLAVAPDDSARVFLSHHTLRWMHELVSALSRIGHPLYARAGDIALAVLAQHAEGLGVEPSAPRSPEAPSSIDLLDRRETGLRQIATYLVTPARAGFYLTKDEIAELSGGLPRGFGSRRLVLTNVLSAGVGFEAMAEVVERLKRLTARVERQYFEIAADPVLTPFVRPSLERLSSTRAMLGKIEAEVLRRPYPPSGARPSSPRAR